MEKFQPERTVGKILIVHTKPCEMDTGKVIWLALHGHGGSWGYPHSWMVFVRANPIYPMDDDWGYPYDETETFIIIYNYHILVHGNILSSTHFIKMETTIW